MESSIRERYDLWLKKAVKDPDLTAELRKMEGNDAEIEDCFYRDLEFGTGGLRGVIGAGSNRMNYYTVARATQGLAEYVLSLNKPGASVALAYDSRNKSDYFAKTAAEVLAGNGIKCHIYGELTPTPMLSFAVRFLSCEAGIVITASHNPAKYNGYKAYGNDGCQLGLEASEMILDRIKAIDEFDGIKTADFDEALEKGLIAYIDGAVAEEYFKNVRAQAIYPGICADSGLRVVYTPLNGTGNKPVRRILREIGVKDVIVVPEQENPDGNFPTCPYPNPEFREALEAALRLCEKENPDLLIATDPDCDRMGIAVRDGGEYSLFTGNEVGALLLEYICRGRRANGTMPDNPITVKSIVSTAINGKIAEKYGVRLIDVLTGFKFIGEQVGELEKRGEQDRFIYGFEESYGYLAGSYVRDKDAVVASMLICEMAARCRSEGKSLIEAREEMYEEYGYYIHPVENIAFEGASGMAKMKAIMENIRSSYPRSIAGVDAVTFTDYSSGTVTDLVNPENPPKSTGLPKSDVVKLTFSDGAGIIARPSGTEPKLKIYYTCVGANLEEAKAKHEKMAADFSRLIAKN
ncbi:MAG: phospho-sugar mutase [Oscillospiraceae bacterium]|jgi:phosphoglucomutase|nr:phospho-sugar mutase [Oscillospiraceae bacterium]